MIAGTKIWAEMTRKVGVSPSSAPLRKSLERVFDGNSQLGASSIGFQVGGSRSPPLDPRRESDIVRFNFFFEPILIFVAAASWLQRPLGGKLSLVISVSGSIISPLFSIRDPLALHYIPIKHPPLCHC